MDSSATNVHGSICSRLLLIGNKDINEHTHGIRFVHNAIGIRSRSEGLSPFLVGPSVTLIRLADAFQPVGSLIRIRPLAMSIPTSSSVVCRTFVVICCVGKFQHISNTAGIKRSSNWLMSSVCHGSSEYRLASVTDSPMPL